MFGADFFNILRLALVVIRALLSLSKEEVETLADAGERMKNGNGGSNVS